MRRFEVIVTCCDGSRESELIEADMIMVDRSGALIFLVDVRDPTGQTGSITLKRFHRGFSSNSWLEFADITDFRPSDGQFPFLRNRVGNTHVK